ncbi:MAG: hypothetical protein AMJ92_08325 [candidate division Zixibacteria bacterium SM23_81]|nr:MAG: hypothetical protein AMJ92_08325 [candidate division Zixibacteria bacterium SM23_81]
MSSKILRSSMVLSLLVCVLYVSTVLIGCACHPSSEQLNQLEMTKAAALSAEEEVQAKTQERKNWENKLRKEQQELKKAEDDLKAVQEALAQEGE